MIKDEKMDKINLGCGNDIREGYINIDIDKNSKADIILDISNNPLPFNDNTVSEVLAFSILEHVDNYEYVIDEIYRVCKNKAIVKVIVPHFSSSNAFLDDHKRFFNREAFLKWVDGFSDGKKDAAYYPKEFFPDNKQKLLEYGDNAGFIRNVYFKRNKIRLSFARGLNPLNYIAPIFNLSKRLMVIYEGTILKSIFSADFMYIELEVIKK